MYLFRGDNAIRVVYPGTRSTTVPANARRDARRCMRPLKVERLRIRPLGRIVLDHESGWLVVKVHILVTVAAPRAKAILVADADLEVALDVEIKLEPSLNLFRSRGLRGNGDPLVGLVLLELGEEHLFLEKAMRDDDARSVALWNWPCRDESVSLGVSNHELGVGNTLVVAAADGLDVDA